MAREIEWGTTKMPRVMNKPDAYDLVRVAESEDAARRYAHAHKELVIFRAVDRHEGVIQRIHPWEVDTDL